MESMSNLQREIDADCPIAFEISKPKIDKNSGAISYSMKLKDSLIDECKMYLSNIGFTEIVSTIPDIKGLEYEYSKPPYGRMLLSLFAVEGGAEVMEIAGSVIVSMECFYGSEEESLIATSPITVTEIQQLKFLVENRRTWRTWHL